MIIIVEAVFAYLFGLGAHFGWVRARAFLGHGWLLIKTYAPHRHEPPARHAVGEGGRFVLAGLAWLVTAIIALGFALGFGWRALHLLLG